jgi:uncharacterized protein (TIGR02145 family)
MSGVGNTHSESLINGTYDNNIGNSVTTLTTYCNDKDGYIVYAIGSSNNEEGNTNLVGNNGSNIATGTATYGNTSNWAMKLASLDNTLTMNSTYTSDFASIPASWTEVAKKESGTTDSETGSSITTTYAVYVSNFQAAGKYSGQVKYAMFHPSNMTAPTTLNQAYAAAGKSKITTTDPNTGETGSYYTMQDMTTAICNAVNIYGEASETKLIDTRDSKFYYVTKLNDGHCWMTQNLDFNIDSTKTYTHADTDLGWDPNNFNANATWTPDPINGKYNLSINGTSVTSWANSNVYPYSADPGNIYYYDCESTSIDCTHYHAGNYYNWTASAASNNSNNLAINNNNAATSICPAGWRLPKISENEFGNLFYIYNIIPTATGDGIYYADNGFNNIRRSPLWFVQSGEIDNGNKVSSGSVGFYWSSSAANNNSLAFNSGRVYPKNGNNKGLGFSIRCLAR